MKNPQGVSFRPAGFKIILSPATSLFFCGF